MARDLHDELGQSLAGLALRAEVLEKLIRSDTNKAVQQVEEITQLIASSTDNMYDLILNLRPSAIDDLGLVPAFRSYVKKLFENTGTEINIVVHDLEERLPPDIEIALFRIYCDLLNIHHFVHASKNLSLL